MPELRTPPILAGLATLAAVATPGVSAGDCGAGSPTAGVRWIRAAGDADRLAPWCAAVGAPLLMAPRAPVPVSEPVSSLVLVSWNVKGGSGDLGGLVRDLRSGVLGGGHPAQHFVMLLQEAVRVGDAVPTDAGFPAVSPRPVGAPTDPERSVEVVAERAGLFLFYAPSMRNGEAYREDRGNAILSTLPLVDPVAIELPFERQRRIALTARVALPREDGVRVDLRLVNAHLDNTSRVPRLWRSLGRGRARQAGALIAALEPESPAVLGGDLNTWFGESEEPAVELLRERFGRPATLPGDATYAPPYGLPERQVDYLLLRLPETWEGGYRVAGDRRRSDHAPLLGWLELPAGSGEPAGSPEP